MSYLRFLLPFLIFFTTNALLADPMECVSKEQAKQYVDLLQNAGYVLENCYYCTPAHYRLIRVDEVYTKNCHWNDPSEEYATAIYAKGKVVYTFSEETACVSLTNAKPVNEPFDDLLILNYAYTFDKKGRSKLLSAFYMDDPWSNCGGLDIPSYHVIKDKEYQAWYRKHIATTYNNNVYSVTGAEAEPVKEIDLPSNAVFKGEFENAVSWKDQGGTNFFIISKVEKLKEYTSDLYVYQYVVKNGQTRLVWDIKDFGTALCPVYYEDNSLQIIDLDQDGIMETSFIYAFGCDGLDPTVTKLMMHHKGKKLAIRGQRVHQEGDQAKMTPDASFKEVTPIFRNFAVMQWENFIIDDQAYLIFVVERTSDYIIYGFEDLSSGKDFPFLLAKRKVTPPEVYKSSKP